MDNHKKELLVLADYTDLKTVDRLLLDRCDRVAMTGGAMPAFEEENLSYMTFEDFYEHKRFRADNVEFISDMEKLFSALDGKYGPFLDFPRPFTGNIYWFLSSLTDLFYLSKVSKEISSRYDKVYMVSNYPQQPLKSDIGFSAAGVMIGWAIWSLQGKVDIMKMCLAGKYSYLRSDYSEKDNPGYRQEGVVRRLKNNAKGLLRRGVSFMKKRENGNETPVFIIQDGYEVDYIKKHMGDFELRAPLREILPAIDSGKPDSIEPLFGEEVSVFTGKWFPFLKKEVFEIFRLYHEKIICRLNHFSRSFDAALENGSPSALLFSIGANKLYEDAAAHIANIKGVPVFYFQHGFSTVFYNHPYEKYFEHNVNIKKINILQSRVEYEILGESVFSEAMIGGSAKLHNLYLKTSKKSCVGRKEALYCPVGFNVDGYKELTLNIPDREIFESNKAIMAAADKFGIRMDIKVFPGNEPYYCMYFDRLIRMFGYKDINTVKGVSAEAIFGNYGILILDSITSSLFPCSVVLNIPVIMYMKDSTNLRRETAGDVEKRFYLAKDAGELEKYLGLYAVGKLDAKFSPDIVDRYAFPVREGDPSGNIADYIRRRLPACELQTSGAVR